MPLFVKRPVSAQVVEAVQMPAGAQASPTRGRPPRPGDYLVTDHTTGESFSMSPEEFSAAYEPLAVPATVLANEFQAQQESASAIAAAGPYRPEVAPDVERLPGYAGHRDPNRTAVTGGGAEYPASDVEPNPPSYPGAGDNSPLHQPMTESISGRPSPTPEVRPRLGDMGEDAPVDTPTGIPAQPGDADKAARDAGPNEPATPSEENKPA
jgi:hypothetical protein